MMYALRDVTATVESIPLICASIMSKKLAEGISSLVLDVKMGSGAFMKTQQDAEALAKSLISIGVDNLVNTVALVTNMDQPLGKFVGNALEIQECLDILKGKTNEENGFDFYQDTRDLSLELAAQMIYCSKNASSLQNARQLAQEALENGKAYSVFEDLCRRQGGIDLSQLPASNSKIDIMSEKNGFIDHINVEKIGLASILLGAGRKTKEDSIDPSAGIEIHFKHGFKKTKGEKLFTVYFSGDRPVEDVKELLLESLSFSNQKPQTLPLIYKVLTEKDL